jgi:serine protease Do
MKTSLLLRMILLPAVVALTTAGVVLTAADVRSEKKKAPTSQSSSVKKPSDEKAADLTAKTPLTIAFDSTPIDRNGSDRVSYASIVKQTAASVVYVHSSKTVKGRDMSQLFNDPMFRRFFDIPEGPSGNGRRRGNRTPDQVQQGLGSGVVITSDGYILTNNHVIDGADELKVSIGESTKKITAKVVGRDEMTDIAVLKIEAQDLKPALFGDSEQLEVGDVVLAIGNPFGVGQSVSRGIVSALSRGVGIGSLEDFIQTDAAINPGNSGGALLDTKGRLVGINTAILSRSGGFNGVGFAIPINLVRAVAEQIVNKGRFERGMLGVYPQDIDEGLAGQFGTDKGVVISELTADGPAEKAGLKAGDVITKINGKEISDARQLLVTVGLMAPGTEVKVEYLRDGKSKTVAIKLAKRTEGKDDKDNATPEKSDEGVLNGVTVGDITAQFRSQLRIPARIKGVIITEIDPDCPSARQGLREGDVILELNQQPVTDAENAVRLSEEIKGPRVMVRIWREGRSQYLGIDESRK